MKWTRFNSNHSGSDIPLGYHSWCYLGYINVITILANIVNLVLLTKVPESRRQRYIVWVITQFNIVECSRSAVLLWWMLGNNLTRDDDSVFTYLLFIIDVLEYSIMTTLIIDRFRNVFKPTQYFRTCNYKLKCKSVTFVSLLAFGLSLLLIIPYTGTIIYVTVGVHCIGYVVYVVLLWNIYLVMNRLKTELPSNYNRMFTSVRTFRFTMTAGLLFYTMTSCDLAYSIVRHFISLSPATMKCATAVLLLLRSHHGMLQMLTYAAIYSKYLIPIRQLLIHKVKMKNNESTKTDGVPAIIIHPPSQLNSPCRSGLTLSKPLKTHLQIPRKPQSHSTTGRWAKAFNLRANSIQIICTSTPPSDSAASHTPSTTLQSLNGTNSAGASSISLSVRSTGADTTTSILSSGLTPVDEPVSSILH